MPRNDTACRIAALPLAARNNGEGLFLEFLLDDHARYNLEQRPILEELHHRGEE